ncbi:MAG TPA: phenylacetate--CoA ligase family protein [Candidatus Competibacteraceae bacterium]|nr:phenylacetate--CoA ligase family protein [Candidatus Competibacteraceae bacterium]
MFQQLQTQLIANFLFPLHERLKGHNTVHIRRFLEESQWWDSARLQNWQLQRLQVLLLRAGVQVPYYRHLFSEIAFNPTSVADLSDLQKLPFLTKDLIRAQTEDFKAADARNLARFNTGGSSGQPLIFFIGKERISHDVAAKWRATRWWGVDIGDPEIVVWGSPIELTGQDRLKAWRDRLLRTRLLPAFEMSEAKLDSFIAAIRAMRPKMLFGYPSALSFIARHACKRGQRMDDLGIRVAFVTSERLYDEQKTVIAETFGCQVANGYGGRDAGFIAHECPHGGMHITAEDIIVEIVSPDGHVLPPGQAGEIVVTHLATGEFPFIRYRTGDIAVLDDQLCSCERGLPLLREIQGRATDFVMAADGTVMHGLALIYILRDLPTVEAFKIIQESLGRTVVQVVPGTGFSIDDEQRIVQGLKQRLGEEVAIDVEKVSAIPAEQSGKYRYVISKV